MTSKNLFLTSMKENAKRRVGYVLLLLLVELFHYPIFTLMSLASALRDTPVNMITNELVFRTLNALLGVNMSAMVISMGFGIFAAIQGFSYLYSRRKLDLYHSVPVSRVKRFIVICVNSFVCFAVVHIICVLAGVGVAIGYHCMTTEFFKWILMGIVFDLISFLAAFSVAMLAVMLTGNFLITLLAGVVLTVYEIVCRLLIEGHFAMFFKHYSDSNASSLLKNCFSSPVYNWAVYVEETSWAGVADIMQNGVWNTIVSYAECGFGTAIKTLILLILFFTISFVLYMLRPSEAAGKAIAFTRIKQPLKVLLMIPIALGSGLTCMDVVRGSFGFEIFGLVIGLLLGHCIIEILFEFDLKASLHHFATAGISAIAVILIVGVFKLDVLGYDSFVPKAEDVQSAGVYIEGMQNGDFINFTDEGRFYVYARDQVLKTMKLTDTKLVCELAQRGMKEEKNNHRMMYITYHMKNGNDICRKMVIDLDEDAALLESLFTNPEYVSAAYQLNTPEFEAMVDHMNWSFWNGMDGQQDDTHTDIRLLYDTFREEYNVRSFEDMRTQKPVGLIRFEFTIQAGNGGSRVFTWEYPVYASFEKTLSLCEKNNQIQTTPELANATGVVSITVDGPSINLDDPANNEDYWQYDYEYKDYVFREDEEISKILPLLWPSELSWWMIDFENSCYSADVYFEDGSRCYCSFEKGKVPEFVLNRLLVD